MKASVVILAVIISSCYCNLPLAVAAPMPPLSFFKVDAQGQRQISYPEFDTCYPTSAMAKIIDAMADGTQILVRPFNTGATPSIKNGVGMGKAMNIKGKSSLLKQPNLQGRIPYIQDNRYTGRQLTQDHIIKIGKYIKKDNIINDFIRSQIAGINLLAFYNFYYPDAIKKGFYFMLENYLKYNKTIPEDLKNSTLNYAKQRYLAIGNKNGHNSIITEFITKKKVTVITPLPNLEETDTFAYVPSITGNPTTNQIDVLAYTWIKYEQFKVDALEVVADMDILTINFGDECMPPFQEDTKKYYDPTNGVFFADRCQDLAFGIGYEVPVIKNYTDKLIKASEMQGLVKHSIEALNYCYPQPYDVGKDFLLFSRYPKGSFSIKIVKNENNIIANMLYSWFRDSRCVPINPSWMFKVESAIDSFMPDQEPLEAYQRAENLKKKDRNCPTYELLTEIYRSNWIQVEPNKFQLRLPLRLIPSTVQPANSPYLHRHQLRKLASQDAFD